MAHDGGEGKRRGRAACEGAVVVACDGAGDPSMWVGTCGSGPGARGRGRRRGEGRVWVAGGMCVLVGLRRHVCGVIVGNGPCHPCDACVMCHRLRRKADLILCGIDVDGGLACVVMRPDLVGCGRPCTASGSPSLSLNETGPCMIRVAAGRRRCWRPVLSYIRKINSSDIGFVASRDIGAHIM